jgi:hypothetical protein
MIPDRKIVIGNHASEHVFEDWASVEVRCQGATVTVDLELLHPSSAVDPVSEVPIERGDLIYVKFGRRVAGGETIWTTKAKGAIVALTKAITHRGDVLRMTIDAAGGAYLRAAEEPIVYERWELPDILADIYKDRLGFRRLTTNLPDPVVPYFEIDVSTPLHAAAQRLVAGYAPKTCNIPDATEGVGAGGAGAPGEVAILDTRHLVSGLPAEELGPGDWVLWTDETPPPTIINWVLITYSADGLADDVPHSYTEEWEDLSPEGSTPGEIRPRQEQLVRKYREDPADPDRITRRVVVKARTIDYDDEGRETQKTETEVTFKANTFDAITSSTESKKWASVLYPGGGREFKLTRTEVRHFDTIRDRDTGEYVPIGERWTITGEVLYPERVPLDEGSRGGLVSLQPGQYLVSQKIETGHLSYVEVGSETHWTEHRRDDISGEPLPPRSGKFPSTQRQSAGPGTATYEMFDEASLERGDGLRPRVSFDGTLYGLEESIKIVRDRLFGGFAAVEPTATVTLLYPDPWIREGRLYNVRDRDGNVTQWLVVATTDFDAPGERETYTRLTLVKVGT